MQELLESVNSLSTKERKALAALLKRQGVNLYGLTPIFKRGAGEPALLSYAQQRQWFLWQLEPDSAAYHISTALRLKGQLNPEALRHSFVSLISRHETLRSTFRQDGEQALQVIHPDMPFELSVLAIGGESKQIIRDAVEAETRRPFDLEHGPLLRVKLLRIAAQDHVLVLTMHHIVSDGWSMPLMVDELIQLYEGYNLGQEVNLPGLAIQYADYAIWQRNWMEAGEQERQLTYWKEQLSDRQPVLELPTDRPRPAMPSRAGALVSLNVDAGLVRRLKVLAQSSGATLFMVLLASFQTLLHRYSGQDDIRVGIPIANRNRVETEQLIGFFVNTQVLRAQFELHTRFSDLLEQVKQRVLGSQAHQDLPFEQLVAVLQPERSLSHTPLFQVMYNHQTQVKGERRSLSDLEVEGVWWESHTAQFDLTLNTFEHGDGMGASLTYATDLFELQTIERIGQHWVSLLESVVLQPEQRIAQLPMLSAAERSQMAYDWNNTDADYPKDKCLHQLIDEQVAKTPQATALVFGDQVLSYQELNQRANRLAHKLRELGVGPDVLVGIAVERSLEMVVGLLGVLKAGGAYIPLDPEYPHERLSYMLEDSQARLLLTLESLSELLCVSGVNAWCLDSDWHELEGYPDSCPESLVHPEHLAYCIYTSGSTGKPKGVAVRHSALVNFLYSMACEPGMDAADRMLSLTSLSFDIAGLELYLPLLVGGATVLLEEKQNKDPHVLLEVIEKQSINIIQATPSTWRMLQETAGPEAFKKCKLLSGGEALPLDLANCLLEQGSEVWNLYGPTETTIWSAAHRLTDGAPQGWLGRPIRNTALHIIESSLDFAPVGGAGELLIGGQGLARGYLNRPGLTAERFIPNPFDVQGGARLYRTGDLARYRANGVIEYMGRIDHQVKIRGFRIELGEIEARLLEQDAVRETVVVAQEGAAGKQLVGYVVPENARVLESPQAQLVLRDSLRLDIQSSLPDYMVPSHLIFLSKLPLTPNGKLNRNALPLPSEALSPPSGEGARTRLERQLVSIWSEVLSIKDIGLDDDFFALGGHSILMLGAVGRIRDNVDKHFAVYDFMMNTTIRKQAGFIRSAIKGFRNSLIALNSCNAPGRAIYCLPPGGGSVFSYYSLAHKLNDICPVYGLLNKAFVSASDTHDSWAEMVDYYLNEIISSQPQGPYRLLGWSTGGALVIDIAHALEKKGQEVEFAFLIDPMLPKEFSEFYAVNEPADPAVTERGVSMDVRNSETVQFIRAFFSEYTDDQIMSHVHEARGRGLEDELLVEFLFKALAGNADYGLYKEVYENYALMAEVSIGYDTFAQMKALSEEFFLKTLTVRPDCWWSSVNFTDIGRLEQRFIERCAVQGIAFSCDVPVAHEKMLFCPDLLASLANRVCTFTVV